MLQLTDVPGITIDGAETLDGNKASIGNQRIFGISLRGGSNVEISGITVQNMPASGSIGGNSGDVIYIGKNTIESSNITVEDVTNDGNVRNGIAITATTDVKISTVIVRNITGTKPGAEIDIEHDFSDDRLRVLTH